MGIKMRWLGFMAVFLIAAAPGALRAAENPFAGGWQLDGEASSLTFVSVKNESKVETSSFATLRGGIAADGVAEVTIPLDSVDTGIDLRNVRMRFLFFETFLHPEATVTARIDPAEIADLAEQRRKRLSLDFELTLHGVTSLFKADVVVTLITDDQVSVASMSPISIPVAAFGMEDGIRKLEEAAGVKIVPSASVSFDFVFRATGEAPGDPVVAAAPASVALETEGDFSEGECAGRFEILSRTGAVYFGSGSADLDADSLPLLRTALEILQRCPGFDLVVEGHTDSVGGDALNQQLSEARANSVVRYLAEGGIELGRLRAVGYGETRPVQPNDTVWNRSRNRRIEFVISRQ